MYQDMQILIEKFVWYITYLTFVARNSSKYLRIQFITNRKHTASSLILLKK
jgi:hypothetical protein